MKFKQKKITKTTLSEKIADALTLKPRADIEDDQVFGTKPQTVSRADFSTSESEDETAISDFRKRNVNLLSDVSKKYEGRVVSRKELNDSGESSIESDFENEQNGLSKDSLDHSTQESFSEQSDASDTVSKLRSLMTKTDSEDSDVLKKNLQKHATVKKNNKKKTPPDSEDSESDAESDDYSITQFKKQLDDDESDEEVSDDDEDDNEEDDDDDQEGYDISKMDKPMKEEFEHVKKQNISEEAKKGACVRNQLLVWEGLLELRIHLQRCMNTANQMPMPETYENLKENKEFIEECNTTKENVTNILDKFLTLQNELFKKFPETKTLSSKQNKQVIETKEKDKKVESDEEIPSDTDNEEIPSDTEPEDNEEEEKEISPTKKIVKKVAKKRKLDDYETEIASTHKAFKSFRDSTIQKWNDKTRLATAANVKNTPTNTILQQISYILSDRDKLLRRTQLKRSEYDIVGYKKPVAEENGNENGTVIRDRKENDEYIPEIFDDSDFYHQLLRELIECKSADITDPVQLSRQWIALQQMRSKMKRKVDTKATKGRKIKYVVHNKLVNFMAPEKCTTWTDESTNELYSSLFGKMFEQNNVGLSVNSGNFK